VRDRGGYTERILSVENDIVQVLQSKYTMSQKFDTDVTHYRFNPHQPILVIFGRDVAETVCY